MNIAVSNLASNVTAHDLRQLFALYGAVGMIHIAIDRQTGRSQGYGFVAMADRRAGGYCRPPRHSPRGPGPHGTRRAGGRPAGRLEPVVVISSRALGLHLRRLVQRPCPVRTMVACECESLLPHLSTVLGQCVCPTQPRLAVPLPDGCEWTLHGAGASGSPTVLGASHVRDFLSLACHLLPHQVLSATELSHA